MVVAFISPSPDDDAAVADVRPPRRLRKRYGVAESAAAPETSLRDAISTVRCGIQPPTRPLSLHCCQGCCSTRLEFSGSWRRGKSGGFSSSSNVIGTSSYRALVRKCPGSFAHAHASCLVRYRNKSVSIGTPSIYLETPLPVSTPQSYSEARRSSRPPSCHAALEQAAQTPRLALDEVGQTRAVAGLATAPRKAGRWSATARWSTVCLAFEGDTRVRHIMPLGSVRAAAYAQRWIRRLGSPPAR